MAPFERAKLALLTVSLVQAFLSTRSHRNKTMNFDNNHIQVHSMYTNFATQFPGELEVPLLSDEICRRNLPYLKLK